MGTTMVIMLLWDREAIVEVGCVEALVTLCTKCGNASQGLQERVVGVLWGLYVANSISIGQGGGVSPLIALASFDVESFSSPSLCFLTSFDIFPILQISFFLEHGNIFREMIFVTLISIFWVFISNNASI